MKLFTMKEAAKILSISAKTLYQWHWQGKKFPFVKVGGALRVSEDDLIRFVVERKVNSERNGKARNLINPD